MAVRPTTLALENLESRLNLSTLAGQVPLAAFGIHTQERSLFKGRARVISLRTSGGAAHKLAGGTSKISKSVGAPLLSKAGANTPAPAVNLTATNKAITVTWVNDSVNAVGFHIDRSVDGTTFKTVGNTSANKTSFIDRTALTGVTYVYRVTAYNRMDATSSTATSISLIPPPPPVAPTSLVDAKSATSSITLSWRDNSKTESGYHVYRSVDGETYTLIAALKANSKTFTDTQLASGTTYYYELSAWNAHGETYAPIPFTAATLGVAPPAPSGLTFSNVTGSGVTLSWTNPSTPVSGYRVYRSSDGANFTLVGNLTAGTNSFSDTGLAAQTGYAYEVCAWTPTSNEMSKVATVSTLAAMPNAPGSLATSNITSSGLTLSWAPNTANQSAGLSGYRIYRSNDGTNYAAVAFTGVNDSHYNDTNLAAGATYWYKVAAVNSSGQAVSAAVSATTIATAVTQTQPAQPTIITPASPEHLSFSNVTASALTLSWTDNPANQTGIHIYRASSGSNYSLVGSLAPSATTWNDSNLNGGAAYKYIVGAFNTAGEGYSAAATVSTLLAAPNAPTNVHYTDITTSAVTLNWSAPTGAGQTGYRIYRSTDGTNFTLVNTTGGDAAAWTDSSLSAGTDYYYEIGAFNAGGEAKTTPNHTATAAIPSTPPPVPLSPPPTGGTVTFAVQNETSFNELVITGTTGNDSILVAQSGGVLNITANGVSTTYANTFGDMKILGVNGNDTISVESSVNINTLIYGGDGNDTITNLTTGKATIVTIGNGTNNVTGNGVNTAYWVNAADTVHSTSAEVALGGVNRVGNFYQNVSRNLYGQNLTDPTDSGTETRLTHSSFFGTGASMNDINQTGLADCYFLAPLASLAYSEPQKLMNMAVDLGDGTYAFRFERSGTTSYVRVDGDLATGYWNYGLGNAEPGADGNQWGSLFEKAYAFFRSGSNTYASLNWGSQYQTYADLGLSSNALTPSFTPSASVLSVINTNLAEGHGVVASTNSSIASSAPLIGSHVYTVIGAFKNASGTVMIQLRNPWGIDGAGNDGNPNDGLVTIDFATFAANFNALNYANA